MPLPRYALSPGLANIVRLEENLSPIATNIEDIWLAPSGVALPVEGCER